MWKPIPSIALAVITASLLGACSASTELTPRQATEQSERCKQLKRQIKALEGKPVRRTTAIEYYEKECLRSDQRD